MSLIDGSAFQARGPAMEKALLVARSRVRETTKLPRTLDRSPVCNRHRAGRVLTSIVERYHD